MKRAIQADGANELGCVGEGEDAVSMELFGNRLGQCAKHPAREHAFSLFGQILWDCWGVVCKGRTKVEREEF